MAAETPTGHPADGADRHHRIDRIGHIGNRIERKDCIEEDTGLVAVAVAHLGQEVVLGRGDRHFLVAVVDCIAEVAVLVLVVWVAAVVALETLVGSFQADQEGRPGPAEEEDLPTLLLEWAHFC